MKNKTIIGEFVVILIIFTLPLAIGSGKFQDYYLAILPSLVALLGILLAIPILRKKLIESHISKALVDIQDANKKLLISSTKLSNKYTSKTYGNEIVPKEELQILCNEICELYELSKEANRDSQTMLYFLKCTLQKTLYRYKSESSDTLFTIETYGLILGILDDVEFFCTQVVPIPQSVKTISSDFIKPEYKKIVTNSEFTKYKHFQLGRINNPNSAHFLMFYSRINGISNTLVKKSAFQTYNSIAPLKKMLFVREIYAPLILKSSSPHQILFETNLVLIGFNVNKHYNADCLEDDCKHIVKFIFTNPSDGVDFSTDYKDIENLKKYYYDSFIENSGFSFANGANYRKLSYQSFSIEFELSYLKKLFIKNKEKLKNKVKMP